MDSLDIRWVTHNPVYHQGRYMCLYGESIYDSYTGFGIHVVGRAGVGKTTLVRSILGERFKHASEDRTIFDYHDKLIIPSFNVPVHELKRVMHLAEYEGEHLILPGLEASLRYLLEVLGYSIETINIDNHEGFLDALVMNNHDK